jgi:hypothetical protein
MSDIVYAVHTRACTYLLDDEGICRWVLSRSGARSDDRCVGAQFVAALDLRSKGGLIGELRIGASALFIRSENGRFMLIRTKAIEHVEIRGAEAEGAVEGESPYQAYEYPAEPEPEPVVLPMHHAVAGVFNAPVPAPEPMPVSEHRVIVQSPQAHYEVPPPAYYDAPPAPMPPPPARVRTEPMPRNPAEPMPRGNTEPPPPPAPPPMVARPPLPIAPPRVPAARPSRSEAQETQPLPLAGPAPALPTGRVPAWPPMLAPPPPQAELLPLVPARPDLPSSEELDDADLEEVGEDDQVYSMEVTLSLPLFRSDPRAGQAFRR